MNEPHKKSSFISNQHFIFSFRSYVSENGIKLNWYETRRPVLGPGFNSGSGRFFVEFLRSHCVCVGFLWVLRLPPTVQKMKTGHSKLPTGVSVSVDGCLSLFVRPTMNWRLVQVHPPFTLKILR